MNTPDAKDTRIRTPTDGPEKGRTTVSAAPVFNASASYQIDKTFQIYTRVDNVFDNHYATFGTFFDTTLVPNFANGGAAVTDARTVSPARPRSFYAGLKATF